jgi:hypothetical protein
MSQAIPFRFTAFAVLVIALAPLSASARDNAAKAAAEAERQKAEIQKQLAGGSALQQRLRVDKFEAAEEQVKVTGVFLDAPPAKADDPAPFDALQEEVGKSLRERLKATGLKFDWSGVKRIEGKDQPHVVLQLAANAAGAKGESAADRCKFDGSRFAADGTLIVRGTRAKDEATAKWLAAALADQLADNPAVVRGKDKPKVAEEVKAVEWKLSAGAVQKLTAAASEASIRRLRVDRAYLTYDLDAPEAARWNTLYFTLAGVRLGTDAVDDEVIRAAVRKHWPELFAGTPRVLVDVKPLLGPGIAEPVARLREVIAERSALDGVRVDAGAEFGPTGELMLAGVQPGLTAEGEKELAAAFQSVLKELIDKKDAAAERYKRLAGGRISTKRMKLVETGKLLADLREWAASTMDDALVSRVYFAADGELKLQYKTVTKADAKKLEAKFKQLAAKCVPEEDKPDAPVPQAVRFDKLARLPRTTAASPQPKPKQPEEDPKTFGAGLTAELRKIVAGDQKKWNGVLIERGFFDANNRYTLRGVVDHAAQNDALAKLLDELKTDPKWAEFFKNPPAKPALDVIPMKELVERVRRVTPAYPEFDGVRIESARYDADVNLIFDAHTAGPIDPAAAPLLAKLIRDHATYKRRAPADKQVRIVSLAGAPAANDQVANFSVGYGAKLLADGEMEKAKQWLEVALLHYPNESGVWFLSAYYNHLKGDAELVTRDLDRVIQVEGPLAFNGPGQRKRRYEAAKDLQGKKRNELEALWLERFRAVKDGVKPLTMTPQK